MRQVQKILSEALDGEEQMAENTVERERLRTTLGLQTNHSETTLQQADGATQNGAGTVSSRATKLRPGRRRPARDAIGPGR